MRVHFYSQTLPAALPLVGVLHCGMYYIKRHFGFVVLGLVMGPLHQRLWHSHDGKRINKIVFKQTLSMTWYVSVQTSKICIIGHAAFNAIACMCQTICDITSRQGEVGWYIQSEGKNSMAICRV